MKCILGICVCVCGRGWGVRLLVCRTDFCKTTFKPFFCKLLVLMDFMPFKFFYVFWTLA